jgi:hypothetical protein
MLNYKLGKVAFVDQGMYSPSTVYNKWDFVTTSDSTYLYINDMPMAGKSVTDTSYWKCLADGKPATTAAANANTVATNVANAETARVTGGSEVKTNKTSDIASNLTSTDKYPTTKGVNDFLQGNVIEQVRSQNINKIPSSKLLDDQLNSQLVEINKSKAYRENAGNNIIYDPYFKYGIMLSTVDPQIIPFGGGVTLSLVNGEAIGKSSITTAKGMQIMARFTQGWATKYGLKAGDTIKVGAYIKAVVGSGATVTNYGTYARNDLPASQITYTFNRIYLPLSSYTDWQWIENTLTLKTDGTDINQATDFSLAYFQVTDPNAATTPTELHIKQPCILFNPSASATGFFESKRAQTIDYLYSNNASIPLIVNSLTVLGDLTVNGILALNNLIFNGGQVESTFLNVITEQMKTRWIALSDNQCFPTVGAFLGLKNGSDLVLCINGVETKLN